MKDAMKLRIGLIVVSLLLCAVGIWLVRDVWGWRGIFGAVFLLWGNNIGNHVQQGRDRKMIERDERILRAVENLNIAERGRLA